MIKINYLKSFALLEWRDASQFYQIGPALIESMINENHLVRITNRAVFGATHNGEVYASSIWYVGSETDKLIHELIESGLTPYQALEFIEL